MTISVTHDRFKLAQVFTISRGSRSEINVLTVRVTRGGATGWGECDRIDYGAARWDRP